MAHAITVVLSPKCPRCGSSRVFTGVPHGLLGHTVRTTECQDCNVATSDRFPDVGFTVQDFWKQADSKVRRIDPKNIPDGAISPLETAMVDEALDRLAPLERTIVSMHFVHEKSIREIASELDLSKSAVGRIVSDIKEKLSL